MGILDPLKAVWPQLSSRKFLNVLFCGAMIFGPLIITWSTYTTPAAKAIAYSAAVGSFATVCGINIHGIMKEDVSRNTPPPTQQVNVGSDVKNTPAAPVQTDPPTPAEAAAPPAPRLKPVTLTADEIRWLREQAAKARAQTPA